MDADHFDALSRAVARITRRASIALGFAAAVGFAAVDETGASRRDRKFRRRMKRRHRRFRRRVRNSTPETGVQTCAGSNGCGDLQCPNSSPGCLCRIESGTGASICAGPANDVLTCDQCEPTQVCINLSACGGAGAVACAVKCP